MNRQISVNLDFVLRSGWTGSPIVFSFRRLDRECAGLWAGGVAVVMEALLK
jgi:hypothetical protein